MRNGSFVQYLFGMLEIIDRMPALSDSRQQKARAALAACTGFPIQWSIKTSRLAHRYPTQVLRGTQAENHRNGN